MDGTEVEAAAHVIFGWDPLWVATILLIVTYALIISEKINRAVIALLGVMTYRRRVVWPAGCCLV